MFSLLNVRLFEGRKPFIYISMTGQLFSIVMSLLAGIYLVQWNKWVRTVLHCCEVDCTLPQVGLAGYSGYQ